MKQIWTGPVVQVAAKYGEHAPMAAVCCNACRSCLTTNLVALASAAIAGAGAAIAGRARRLVDRS